jgi:two-component system, OmpR family, sensor kinase
MTALIDDMLTVARLDEEPSLRITPVDIASLVRHLAADARAADPGRKVTVSTPVVLVAHADSARVAQAVLNLLTNARIHTPPDQPIEIDARRDVEGHGIVVSVADHGPGIAADERHRVFDRFTRLDQGRSRAQGGSGLGLAIVASIAHAHGGTVTAGDTDGGGATFTLTLPDTARPDGCATEFEHGGATTE